MTGCQVYKSEQPRLASSEEWVRSASRVHTFDRLIANQNRNELNLLVDPEGAPVLVDHSASFAAGAETPAYPQRFDRTLVDRIRALDRARLDGVLSAWLSGQELEALWARRAAMLSHVAEQVSRSGEAQTLF